MTACSAAEPLRRTPSQRRLNEKKLPMYSRASCGQVLSTYERIET